MKFGFLALAGVLLAGILAATPDRDGIDGSVTMNAAPDSTVTLGTQMFLGAGTTLVAGYDSVAFTFYRNDSLQVTKRVGTLSLKISTVAAPAYGKTATYKGCAQVERGGRLGTKIPAVPGCWSMSFTRTIPPLVVDSVKQIVVLMVPTTVATGAQSQACVMAIMSSGRRLPAGSQRQQTA